MSSGSAFFLLLVSTTAGTDLLAIPSNFIMKKPRRCGAAGDLSAAEAEYTAILAEAYYKLGKVRLAQANFSASVGALEAAAGYGAQSDEVLIDLAIAYFRTNNTTRLLIL